MRVDTSKKWLPVFEALASDVRLDIIQLLSEQERSIKELAEALNLSSAVLSMHVRKLELANIIQAEMVPGRGGARKVCSLTTEIIEIMLPTKPRKTKKYHKTEVAVGHYSDFDIVPTCGLATSDHVIGIFDEPRYFLHPDRVDAKILWFGQGYVEYKIPNYLMKDEMPIELEVSMEISSEAPFANENWPSDISFIFNGVDLGHWTSPGDFGGNSRGKYTPDWWWDEINQFGLLKVLKVNDKGTFIDGEKISSVTLDQLDIEKNLWVFRFAIKEDSKHVGGMTLFGSTFGNYNQDIIFKLYYVDKE